MNNSNIIGRLAFDPELKFTHSGKAVCRFRLVVQRNYKKDEVTYIDCQQWNKPGERLAEYKRKGDQLGVSGELVISDWEDAEGNKRKSACIVADRVDWLGSKRA